MKYVLDTDHMTLLERGGIEGMKLRIRLAQLSPDDYATTIVSFEEQTRGWLSRMARANSTERIVAAYARLSAHLFVFTGITVLPFDLDAAAANDRFAQLRLRAGTQDTRIAAITIANGATLLSRNLSDFARFPDLHVEDWSV